MAKIAIIGSGFSGLSAAAYLSAKGNEVHVFEKNEQPGGRARQLKADLGYVFDMGPSWYWMPDVYERFFNDLGYSVVDFYDLTLLNPSFDVIFKDQKVSIPSNFSLLCELFESIEKGSALQLKKFMQEAKYKYETGMEKLVYMPGLSLSEFADMDLIKGAIRLQVFSSFSKHIRKFFSHPKLIALMEFPVLFLGAMPQDTPALYSLMNYAGLQLGTWYPQGGFGKVIDAMVKVCTIYGVTIHCNEPVEKIVTRGDIAAGVMVNGRYIHCDAVVASADYAYVENVLLSAATRNYHPSYWDKKTFAPSCLIYYIGLNKKISSVQHHTLFFDEELDQHSREIYKEKQWPAKPLFYVCCPSQTDATVAPAGHENLFLLMPIAPGLEDSEAMREKYFQVMIGRMEKALGEELLPFVDFKKSYCINDFVEDYHSYKGNAYGLANTLMQTAVLKPKMINKKINNLFYAGQLTVPGPGVPPALISGKIAAQQVIKQLNEVPYEVVV